MNMMRKYLLMFAAFIAVSAFFTACSSEEDAASPSLEGGVIKAEFTISFPQQMGGFTRQSLAVVQGQTPPVFRGIQNIELLPFSKTKEAINTADPSTITIPSPITLAAGTAAAKYGASANALNTIAQSGALYTGSNSHLYKDIEIAIGTRSFMFYGVAIDETPGTGLSAYTVNGSLVKTDGTTLDLIKFSPRPIYTEKEEGTENIAIDAQATAIAQYLTNIAKVTVGTGDDAVTTLTYFPNFTQLQTGSWNSVKAVIQEMYSSLYNNTDDLSTAIKNAILENATDNAGPESASTGVLAFKEPFASYTYPRNIGLPDGAAYVVWSTTDSKFNVITNDNMGGNIATLDTYAFPASLYYFGLSNIKTTGDPMKDAYTDGNTWEEILAAYNAKTDKNTVVQSTTRSIAIEEQVQYAVGRLDVTVTSKGGTTNLKDNSNQNITFSATDFPITGILVANQKPVDYKFQTSSGFAFTLYDSQTVPETETDVEKTPCLYPGDPQASRKTHTLVLETPDAGSVADAIANVPIAVEFENNSGKIIVGKDNQLIYPNTKFYLVGTLQPYKNYEATDGKVYTGTEDKIKKAFVRDYVTTANFKVESFKNAYNLLPDLRTPSLEIGMSVDLTWQNGISQDIIIE